MKSQKFSRILKMKSLPVPEGFLIGRTIAEDFIDPDTGEVLYEDIAGSDDLLAKLQTFRGSQIQGNGFLAGIILVKTAGFEIGAGFSINTTLPEKAAELLRKA